MILVKITNSSIISPRIANEVNQDIESQSFKSIHWKLLLLNFANNFQDINYNL